MKPSKQTAQEVIAYIKANQGKIKKDICFVLKISADQFQNSVTYIKQDCERVGLKWYMKLVI